MQRDATPVCVLNFTDATLRKFKEQAPEGCLLCILDAIPEEEFVAGLDAKAA